MTHFNGKELRLTNTRGFWVARDGNQVWTRKSRSSLARFLEAKGSSREANVSFREAIFEFPEAQFGFQAKSWQRSC